MQAGETRSLNQTFFVTHPLAALAEDRMGLLHDGRSRLRVATQGFEQRPRGAVAQLGILVQEQAEVAGGGLQQRRIVGCLAGPPLTNS